MSAQKTVSQDFTINNGAEWEKKFDEVTFNLSHVDVAYDLFYVDLLRLIASAGLYIRRGHVHQIYKARRVISACRKSCFRNRISID